MGFGPGRVPGLWNRRHLVKVLAEYVAHWTTRPALTRGLSLDIPAAQSAPAPASVTQVRHVERVDLLGGLVHECRHAA
jgi:hypothetical protein